MVQLSDGTFIPSYVETIFYVFKQYFNLIFEAYAFEDHPFKAQLDTFNLK